MPRRGKAAWKRVGRELKFVRTKAGLTQAQVAGKMGVVPSTISAWESGTRGMIRAQVDQLDQELETSGVIARTWLQSNTPDALPEWYEEVPQLEHMATELREYQSQVFPGLVQTRDYASALLRDTGPWVPDGDLEKMLESRLKRQSILDKDDAPLVAMVVEAPVIERPIGGYKVLLNQLRHVLVLIKRGAITFQVMPRNLDTHPGASGPFRIYTFPDKAPVASAEHMEGEQLMDEMIRVQRCATIFGTLQAEACSPRASKELIRKAQDNIHEGTA